MLLNDFFFGLSGLWTAYKANNLAWSTRIALLWQHTVSTVLGSRSRKSWRCFILATDNGSRLYPRQGKKERERDKGGGKH